VRHEIPVGILQARLHLLTLNDTMRLTNVRHPIIDLISYSILISWAVFWGMVVGGMFEQEILRPRAEALDKRPPTLDHSPSPEVFPGIG
jgi:hypothetical protein